MLKEFYNVFLLLQAEIYGILIMRYKLLFAFRVPQASARNKP